MDVKGLCAIVTGGGSGMGAEAARHLARAGANVCVLDLNKDNAEAVAKEIGGVAVVCEGGGSAAVQSRVTALVQALTGIGTNHITVAKMASAN